MTCLYWLSGHYGEAFKQRLLWDLLHRIEERLWNKIMHSAVFLTDHLIQMAFVSPKMWERSFFLKVVVMQ